MDSENDPTLQSQEPEKKASWQEMTGCAFVFIAIPVGPFLLKYISNVVLTVLASM